MGDSSIHSKPKTEESDDRKLLKVITAFIVVCGTIISIVGVVLISQVYELQKNRVTEYIEVREDIRDLKKSSLLEAEEQLAWRKTVDDRLSTLFKTVNQLVPEVQTLRQGSGNPNPSIPERDKEKTE